MITLTTLITLSGERDEEMMMYVSMCLCIIVYIYFSGSQIRALYNLALTHQHPSLSLSNNPNNNPTTPSEQLYSLLLTTLRPLREQSEGSESNGRERERDVGLVEDMYNRSLAKLSQLAMKRGISIYIYI